MNNLALLIDADNAQAATFDQVMSFIKDKGVITVIRAYGDWSQPHLNSWKSILLQYNIQPVQQFAYVKGKNASDMALTIDAMDLLYTGQLNGFCIVSSDSDFTPLASRIRAAGLMVYGFGKNNTSKSFQTACNQFGLVKECTSASTAQNSSGVTYKEITTAVQQKQASVRDILKNTLAKIKPNYSQNSEWLSLVKVAQTLYELYPEFNVKQYQCATLSKLLAKQDFVELRKDSRSQISIRTRPELGAY